MKSFFSLLAIFIFCVMPCYSEDEVLLTVDGERIHLSEFLFYYNRAKEFKYCTPIEYFDDFLRCKLKVADARSRGLDKNDCFKGRLEWVRHSVLNKRNVINYNEEYIKIGMFTYKLPQDCSGEYVRVADRVMNSIYNRLMGGTSVSEIISMNRDSNLLYENFGNEWQSRTFIPDEISAEIGRISVGGISQTIYSSEGIHIVLLNDRCFMEDSDSVDDQILREAAEALLILEWDKNTELQYNLYSEDDLKRFYKANKSNYIWELPHYKGAVIHCNDEKIVSKLKRRLKRRPINRWNDEISSYCRDNGLDLKYEVGLFCIGNNKYIDKLVFGCGELEELAGYSHTVVIGKCLDYKPEDFRDVYNEVVYDYIKEGEMRFFDELERKYRVEKHIDVLKTVNCSVSN